MIESEARFTCSRCEVTITMLVTDVTVWERACGTLLVPPPAWYMIKCVNCEHVNVGRISFDVARSLLQHGAIHIAAEIDAPGAMVPITKATIDEWAGELATMSEEDVWKALDID